MTFSGVANARDLRKVLQQYLRWEQQRSRAEMVSMCGCNSNERLFIYIYICTCICMNMILKLGGGEPS